MTKGTILVTPRGYAKYGKEASIRLKMLGYEMNVNTTGKPLSRETFIANAQKATGIIVGVDKIDKDLLKQCKKLKAIVKFGVGLDNIDLDTANEYKIKVGRCIGSNSNAVAEFVLGLMLSCARYISTSNTYVRNNRWIKPTGVELFGKTIGIIGFGNIGRQLAHIVHGIGMKVLAYDTSDIPSNTLECYNARPSSIETILKECDFISIHTPLTEKTRNMISTDQFAMMKDSSILINAARGGIVNEKALYIALKNKQIFAAASDVFTSEPPSHEDWIQELLNMDNFILTPHIASRSVEAEQKTAEMATDCIIDLLEENKKEGDVL